MSKPLFEIPVGLTGAAARAEKLFIAQKFHETVAWCEKEISALEKQIPARSNKLPQQADPGAAAFQYHALTLLWVNALAELQEWKAAKEALGKYRVHFPRDPWGFHVGAVVTQRDTQVKDKAAVQRAVELLEGEAKRLETKL